MKTNVITLIVISLFYSMTAVAGAFSSDPVLVVVNEDGNGFAQGGLHSARSSDNDVEMIGCGIKRDQSGLAIHQNPNKPFFGHGRSFCQARDADGELIFCFIDDESVAESLNAMTDASWIQFFVDDFPVCARVDISNQSVNIPFVKPQKIK